MKTKILATSLIASLLLISGCSSTPDVRQESTQNFTKNYEQLPKWVTEDESPFTAVGSAVNKGQSFFHLRNEAVTLAKGALAQKVSAKVEALSKAYFQSVGAQKDATLEDVGTSSTTQVASQTLNGVLVTRTYVAKDGELFVQVSLQPEKFEAFIKNSYKSQAYILQTLNADKSWKELKEETAKLPQNKDL